MVVVAATLSMASLAQKKNIKSSNDSTVASRKDSSYTGYKIIAILDSAQYSHLMQFMKQFPLGNEDAAYIYSLLNGNRQNIMRQNTYAIKPKEPIKK